MRQHRLVCGDERLACLQRRAGERKAGPSDPPISSTTTSMSSRRASSIMSSTQSKREISTQAIPVAVARVDGAHLDGAPSAPGNEVSVGVEQANDARPHGSQAYYRNPHRFMVLHHYPVRESPCGRFGAAAGHPLQCVAAAAKAFDHETIVAAADSASSRGRVRTEISGRVGGRLQGQPIPD